MVCVGVGFGGGGISFKIYFKVFWIFWNLGVSGWPIFILGWFVSLCWNFKRLPSSTLSFNFLFTIPLTVGSKLIFLKSRCPKKDYQEGIH